MNKDFNQSYWEIRRYFDTWDLVVIGAGIVGLSTALSYRRLKPKSKILVLERGTWSQGASTKNAGFACFGTIGELLDDLSKDPSGQSVWETVRLRWEGLKLLRKRLGDKAIDFRPYGGYELFKGHSEFEQAQEHLEFFNRQMKEVTGIRQCFDVAPVFRGLKGFRAMIRNSHEAQLNSGAMMLALEQLTRKHGIEILNGLNVLNIKDQNNFVDIETPYGLFKANSLVVATNGFANQLLQGLDLKPARAQVLVTSVIPSLKLRGAFHLDRGYYYFRNIDQRILLGGGRNLDPKTEECDAFGLNNLIHQELDNLLQNHILPAHPYTIAQRWSGIMGMGHGKKPILKWTSQNVLAVVRMGGMGIAIGSKIADMAATELSKK
ncbi:MAG TPA: FAD-dependent oxidoreductase [Bacteroidia bacterium]|nr:FAD-dependent oxidoreductase [Bacteroidia bacterium]